MLNKIIRFFLENKLVTAILFTGFIGWGVSNAPFNWNTGAFPRDPVPVDAIPNIGENQQIVFTEWMGRSPQDIEDQITYPLTTTLLGVPGVKTIRSNSIFGLSSIYIIFEDNIEFYWSRSRILEKLNSLPKGIMPDGVQPTLGPDATALGQIFWYTLEGRNPETGEPTGGWDPHELRSIQDFYVGYSLSSADGVAEVAPIGGFVKEYQVDIDPNALKAYGVTIEQVMNAVRKSNQDVGARTLEFNKAEYVVRGLGYIKSLEDLEEAVVMVHGNTPIRVVDVAHVTFGPETRRGGLDKNGVEAVGAVVVARYGANPLEVIKNVKEKIKEISPGLHSKILEDGTVSKVTIIPFYDRTNLILETLGTLEEGLTHEILITILVVIILVMNLRASVLISSLLPVGVLITFITMRQFGVDANIVALSGIAIAIGVMVDVGVVFTENIVRHLELPENKGAQGKELLEIIFTAVSEVASAVITALATTVISFLPVFALQAAEGKLFKPLAFTKTFALLAALVIGLIIIPAMAHILFSIKIDKKRIARFWNISLSALGIILAISFHFPLALVLTLFGINNILFDNLPMENNKYQKWINITITLLVVLFFLTKAWLPLGAQTSLFVNFLFVAILIGIILFFLLSVVRYYRDLLNWSLEHKWQFLSIPIIVILFGFITWRGFGNMFGFAANAAESTGWQIRQTTFWEKMTAIFPGTGREFMPSLDEGSFLLMPTTMAHSGLEENIETIRMLDARVGSIPEVESVVGKWGRVKSALDPAPISMFENVVNYKPEFIQNENGHRIRFKVDKEGRYLLQNGTYYDRQDDGLQSITKEDLVEDKNKGKYFRQWRDEIHSPDDIWEQIVAATSLPGLTSAPKLQPIETRLIMLSTGMRAPMGIKVFGPDLETIEAVGLNLEEILQQVPSILPSSVFADRIVGKPYLEIVVDRKAIARYGLTMADMQRYLEVGIGGSKLTTTVEGRERYPVRVRYAREFRDSPESLAAILIPTPAGPQVLLGELAEIVYRKGPQMIKSEDTFLDGYVIFDKKEGYAEVDVVEEAQRFIEAKVESGEFVIPPGVRIKFTGNYENQIRATKRLSLLIPICLVAIFLILYFQFRSIVSASLVFTGIFVAFAGGFIMIWFYGQPWFLDFNIAGMPMRDMFQIHTINLSVAVWVGFIALFGIATDDGVIMGTYIMQVFQKEQPATKAEVRSAILEAGIKRVRPAVMTAATTIIALIPILTSTGKGSDIMVPMAIPLFGGMLIQVITMFVVPVLYCMWQEGKVSRNNKQLNPTV